MLMIESQVLNNEPYNSASASLYTWELIPSLIFHFMIVIRAILVVLRT